MLIVSGVTSCDLVMNNFQCFQVWTMSSNYHSDFVLFKKKSMLMMIVLASKFLFLWPHLKSHPYVRLEKVILSLNPAVVKISCFSLFCLSNWKMQQSGFFFFLNWGNIHPVSLRVKQVWPVMLINFCLLHLQYLGSRRWLGSTASSERATSSLSGTGGKLAAYF